MKFLAPIIFLLIAVSLSAQQNKYEEWYFNTKDSLRIYVKESLSTSKDTVIVLHGGFGANHDYMLDATKGLEGRFHFVFYDQRGSLMSQPSAPEKYLTFDKNVGDIETLMTALNIKRAKFICHSMGDGYIFPCSLQLCVENAIKHNRGSEENPLKINIERKNAFVQIKNDFKPVDYTKGSGLGNQFLEKSYDINFGKKVTFSQNESEYIVEIPVI